MVPPKASTVSSAAPKNHGNSSSRRSVARREIRVAAECSVKRRYTLGRSIAVDRLDRRVDFAVLIAPVGEKDHILGAAPRRSANQLVRCLAQGIADAGATHRHTARAGLVEHLVEKEQIRRQWAHNQ